MGTSNWQNISYCVGILRRLQPASVLDIGTGFGRWGMLCREFLDVCEGREARSLWQVRIEGIEAFPQCLTPLHDYVYDKVHVGDAVHVLPTLGTFDVIYLGDVVEHQSKSRACALLDEAVGHARQAAIVTIPIGDVWPHEMGSDGNAHHTHRSVWEPEDFDRFPGARRRAFSDYLGRTYLVAELPGRAATNDELDDRLDAELLRRVDENLSCRAMTDNPALGLDLSGALLFQLPATAALQRALTQLETDEPWAPALTAAADALFEHCVALQANTSIAPGLAAPPHVADLIEKFGAAVSSLTANARATVRSGD
jgi:hypothetical protein